MGGLKSRGNLVDVANLIRLGDHAHRRRGHRDRHPLRISSTALRYIGMSCCGVRITPLGHPGHGFVHEKEHPPLRAAALADPTGGIRVRFV